MGLRQLKHVYMKNFVLCACNFSNWLLFVTTVKISVITVFHIGRVCVFLRS